MDPANYGGIKGKVDSRVHYGEVRDGRRLFPRSRVLGVELGGEALAGQEELM